ncbi:TonB C-terminal domain-containing protein [Undibacterium oligocarboniphilum]|uniref:TonB C-terminal domain-containing protein n=1 Tax=Undibacterium oligocarboniphilum TaxID=666702 RepID=A0A850QR73_9BURK|nr:TonB C-terminal domain-containing protein [Undibacterium oligocarboniphilum]MBC3870642.1 TonB C-terminal domain-containing protein [Undibacterium oligocarboniphilum]NVO78556.1 TonB C-terminal domain-containing protein [Undibacterium oligocarboniphilum]
MKSVFDRLILSIAVTISLVVHAALLLIHFVMPKPAETQAADPGLEVILVNARHDKKPLKADAMAQADLDGGGAHDSGRSKSPLPDMQRTEDGDNVRAAQRRIAELEQQQQQLLDQAKRRANFRLPQQEKKRLDDSRESSKGQDDLDTSKALARMAAEISQTIEDQNKRPRKTFITPSTQKVGYATYYKELQKRIEDFGTVNFPQKDGKKLYGELIVYIPIFQDGTIYEKEGGPRIEKSSGSKALDKAALRIVRHAAPFGKFPQNMRSTDKDDLWVVITRFKFTRDQQLETELRGGKN